MSRSLAVSLRLLLCVLLARLLKRRKQREGEPAHAWVEPACWLFAGSVLLPALPSLWRTARMEGRGAVIRLAMGVALLRFVPSVRELHHRLEGTLVPAGCVAGLFSSWTLQAFSRTQLSASVLRATAVFAAPGVLLEGIEDPGASDIIALAGAVLSVLLGQESAAVLLLLMVTGGEALEERVVDRAGDCVRTLIAQQHPTEATTVDSEDVENERRIAVKDLCPGDLIVLREGDVVPCDAAVVSGVATYDESALTGESLAQARLPTKEGEGLLSGAVLVQSEGKVIARVKRAAALSTFALMARALEAAQENSADIEVAGKRAAALFPALTFAAAAGSFAARGRSPKDAWATVLAMLSAATTCPLAIGVPVAFLSGISAAARHGVTVKSGVGLEALGRATMVVFDKTGTLTSGDPKVTRIIKDASLDLTEEDLLRVVCAAQEGSNHVLARAMRERRDSHDQRLSTSPLRLRTEPGSFEAVTGMGVRARVGKWSVLSGSAALLAEHEVRLPEEVAGRSEMAVHVALDGQYAGTLLFSDPIRDGALELVHRLRALKPPPRLAILSGDRSGRLAVVAEELGIDTYHCCLPHQKAEQIQKWKREGEKVVFVGDGTNDTAALAEADVGVSVGTNALASESADIVLVKPQLLLIDFCLRLGRCVVTTSRRGVKCGMGASIVQMACAEAGLVSALTNSFLQEIVDLSAILYSASVLVSRP